MEPVASNIQVLLQAAEFLERREREAEHGYASLCPHRNPGPVYRRRKRSPQASGALDSGRSVHNELEKRRRAQLKRCLEQLKQQMPLGPDCARYTTLSLLRWARTHIQKLEAQEQRARRLKEKLRSKRQSLRRQLERLRGPAGPRADGLDSSGLSSERSDSDRGECPEAKGSCGLSGPWPLTGGLPVQRKRTWTWRAWRPGPRLSCCGASARAGSTATPTAAAAGCEPPHAALRSRPEPAASLRGCLRRTERTLPWEQVPAPPAPPRPPRPPTPTAGCRPVLLGEGSPVLPPRPAGQAACARATLPGLSCSTWLCCPQGEQKTLGPSRSFLEKAPRDWTVFALNLRIFANFLSVVLPDENGELPGTDKLEKRK
ncbi:max dimerization protein 3 isoform X3 [Mirounga angustirostris]|uniref:max dimerization protein 3 isoform X3 n=1 Tax=Mirounga angustirostris TaxID=9716 RepID=UPI00313DD8C3